MKPRYLITIIFLSLFLNSFADIAVKSFKKLPGDMDARVNFPITDQNGDLCALIKVVSTYTDYTFDAGQLGIVKTAQKPSEIWVYVPWGLKRFSIFHSQLGQLRDYQIPESIEEGTVYEMVLITGRIETNMVEEIPTQWLVITPSPSDAMVYLDDQFVKEGIYQTKLKPGKYTYRVEAPMYHTKAGTIEISDKKEVLNIELKPAFGYLSIKSNPEVNAKIIIDGKPVQESTPITTDALSSGQHTIQLIKEMYEPATQIVTVDDGVSKDITLNLIPNFAEIQINVPENASLYINNQSYGTGSWIGKLAEGVYTIEARIDKHRPTRKDIEVISGKNQSFELQPKPIYGSLDIMTTPMGASITINGEEYGTTPNTIKQLLIGDYQVLLNLNEYETMVKTITIHDGKSSMISETLRESNIENELDNSIDSSNKQIAKQEKLVVNQNEIKESTDKEKDVIKTPIENRQETTDQSKKQKRVDLKENSSTANIYKNTFLFAPNLPWSTFGLKYCFLGSKPYGFYLSVAPGMYYNDDPERNDVIYGLYSYEPIFYATGGLTKNINKGFSVYLGGGMELVQMFPLLETGVNFRYKRLAIDVGGGLHIYEPEFSYFKLGIGLNFRQAKN